jgi:hypothetical protein
LNLKWKDILLVVLISIFCFVVGFAISYKTDVAVHDTTPNVVVVKCPCVPLCQPNTVYVDKIVYLDKFITKFVDRIVEKPVITYVDREVIKYTDKIVYVDKIVEKIVEKEVIKEVIVEKIVYKDKIVYVDRIVYKDCDEEHNCDKDKDTSHHHHDCNKDNKD